MLEKRRYPRLDVDLPVILRHGGRLIPATALNLSCGGMFVKVRGGEFSADSPVELIFDLGGGDRDVAMSAKITHLAESKGRAEIGVQFLNLYSLSHKAVQEYLRKGLN